MQSIRLIQNQHLVLDEKTPNKEWLMSEVFNIFNSILKTKLKKSDRFSNFRFTNSQMFGDGLGVSLAYSDGKGTVR